MTRSHSLAAAACAALLATPAAAATFDITGANVPQSGSFAPADGDVFSIDAGDFGVTAPLSFQNDVFGNPALSNVGADNPNAIASDVNVVVIQNRDNDDADGQFPSN